MLSQYSLNSSAWKKRLYWAAVERRNLTGVRRFHATSRAEAGEVRSLRLRAPADIVPLGLENAAFETPRRPDSLRERCSAVGVPCDGRPIVLFLSRLHPKKGVVDFLLPAFAAMRSEAVLAIAGGPDPHAPEHAEQIRREVTRLGLAGRTALLGPIESTERWNVLDGADVFVLPSRSENFGQVVTEAMARGIPVLVSVGAQVGEHVVEARCGLVVELLVEQLAAAMDTMLGKPDRRAEMGARGRLYAERLRWEVVAESVYSMYLRCTN